jgi:Putative Flp pilus-assembly TadE/G-like
MQKNILSRPRHHEQGQTIILVAISLVSLLAMAALAIDVVTLYVARTEIQRAADATALAAAKAIADSGVTSLDPTSSNLTAAKTLAQTMATTAVTSLLSAPAINLVAGATPALNTLTPIPIDWNRQGNPHVTINLKASNLPTFFSKIWGGSAASVTATATAEVYNPANLTTITPIAPTSVKPWLVANVDPTSTAPQFVNTTTWVVDSGVIGQSLHLVSDCNSGISTACTPLVDTPPTWTHTNPPQVDYLPAAVTTPTTPNVCPACAGATDYENSIECADVATSYKVLSCGGGSTNITWDNTINPGSPPNGNNATPLGAECLIHATSSGSAGQDVLTEPTPVFSAPYQIKQQSGTLVTTSSSIVTIPIFDSNAFNLSSTTVTVVGFLQAFINQVDPGPAGPGSAPTGSINITVLNIAGCSPTNNGANPVIGGSGTSPVPVRLITPP